MNSYIAVQVDPTEQESPLQYSLEETCFSLGINVYGNSEFPEFVSPEFELAKRLAEDSAYCSRLSESGELMEFWRWQAYAHNYSDFAEVLNSSIVKHNSMPITLEEVEKFRKLVKSFLLMYKKRPESPERFHRLQKIAVYLMELQTGEPQVVKLIRGKHELDWAYVMAPQSLSDYLPVFEAEFFNTGKEWLLYRVRSERKFKKLIKSTADHSSLYKKIIEDEEAVDYLASWYSGSYTVRGVKEELVENGSSFFDKEALEKLCLLPFGKSWYPKMVLGA